MTELISMAEFWFGAFLLGAYQVSKFSELSALDPVLNARSTRIPNLRASDFAGRFTFFATLSAFLATTLLVFLMLCLASPTILHGWAQVSGAKGTEDLEKFLGSIPYPLYIAAAFMGLTQPSIPILSRIGDMQRNLFHALIGVPRRVVSTSGHFSNQIFARSPNARDLAKVVLELVGDSWIERIGAYADTEFYHHQITRLKLDNDAELKELLKGSSLELKGLAGQLIYASALATVRASGGKCLARLADDLEVSMPPQPPTVRDFLAGGILFLIGMTFLWSLIPMFDRLADRYLRAGSRWDFWPDDLAASGQYLMSQVVPIFIATGMALATWTNVRGDDRTANGHRTAHRIAGHFDRYAGLFVAVVLVVVSYDLLQAFFDYGYWKEDMPWGSFWTFVLGNLPFYLLHSFVSLVVCFIVLLHLDDLDAGRSTRVLPTSFALATCVGLTSLFYAVARLSYQYGVTRIDGVDFVILVVALNVSAALLALATATFCRRRLEAVAPERDMAPVTPQGASESAPIRDGRPQETELVPPVPLGG